MAKGTRGKKCMDFWKTESEDNRRGFVLKLL